MPYHFRISVKPIKLGEPVGPKLQFDVINHDDILAIVDKVRKRRVVDCEDVASFATGLKLFSEAVLKYREDPVFAPLWPHIGAFMKRLKALPQDDNEGEVS